jgi:hypothetical protein
MTKNERGKGAFKSDIVPFDALKRRLADARAIDCANENLVSLANPFSQMGVAGAGCNPFERARGLLKRRRKGRASNPNGVLAQTA